MRRRDKRRCIGRLREHADSEYAEHPDVSRSHSRVVSNAALSIHSLRNGPRARLLKTVLSGLTRLRPNMSGPCRDANVCAYGKELAS